MKKQTKVKVKCDCHLPKDKGESWFPRKTMSETAKKFCMEKGYYKNGECPLCGDYLTDYGQCMNFENCNFVSALVKKSISQKPSQRIQELIDSGEIKDSDPRIKAIIRVMDELYEG